MNDCIMKADYIKPETRTVTIELGNGSIICASGDALLFNPVIDGRDVEED